MEDKTAAFLSLKREIEIDVGGLHLSISQSCTYCGSLRRIADHPAER
jgi:hypothetical protein